MGELKSSDARVYVIYHSRQAEIAQQTLSYLISPSHLSSFLKIPEKHDTYHTTIILYPMNPLACSNSEPRHQESKAKLYLQGTTDALKSRTSARGSVFVQGKGS